MSGISRRSERLLFAFATTLFAGTSVGLSALVMKLMRRHGETLLDLESLRATGMQPRQPSGPQYQRTGFPRGSVAMNFELPGIDGNHYTFTSLKRERTLLIFIAPDCEQSRVLLQALNDLQLNLDPPECRIALISTGSFNDNQELAREFGLDIPLLVQEREEVSRLYFASGTPMAYLMGPTSTTVTGRINGAQAILGVAVAALKKLDVIPDDRVLSVVPPMPAWPMPLHAGDELPDFSMPRLDDGILTRDDLLGQRTLLVMFDPTCAPCIELLPDLQRLADSAKIQTIMVTRRDPEETRKIARTQGMTFPIGVQDNWEISRQVGAVAVPAACIIDVDGYLETDMVAGRQEVFNLLSRARSGPVQRKLVSLTTYLRGRGSKP